MEDVNWIVVVVVILVLGSISALLLRGKFKAAIGNINVESESQKKEATAAKGAEIEGSEIGSVTAARGDASYDTASAMENAKVKNSKIQEIVGVDMTKQKK